MVDFRLLIGDPKSKRTFQKVLKPEEVTPIKGMKVGETIRGEIIGLTGYELKITGGSDKDGFPMRADVEGTLRKRLLLSTGPGYNPKRAGLRKRRMIRGNIIGDDIAQLNTKIIKHGKTDLMEFFGIKPKEEEKKEEATKEEEK